MSIIPIVTRGQEKLTQNIIAPAVVKIDGKFTEWPEKQLSADRTGKINYIIANDDKNLYVVIKTADQSTTMRIMSAGITLAVNPKGKKKETYAVTFPIISQKDMAGQERVSPGVEGPDINAMQRSMRSKMVIIGVKGFPLINFDQISIYNSYGIKTAIDFDEQNNLCYEAAIPLGLLSLNVDQTDPLACNIKVNGFKMPDMPGDAGAGMGGGPPGGMGGGPPGGGMGSGPPPGGMRNMDIGDLLKSTDFWVKQTLVKP
ncbi:hypothetical protein KXQ82_04370 [Mucilaginibacter sp. HMF5004]|uniref:hypothetical protein n=1 Tax=Mucilaginibacter rivuli TaxID=2857527 RepID=UPI001C5DDB2D|nr:hypothetical protein [Mucilaginibacter rivuli]MBW4888932.1 hypothetical protein [Mucilaginibacter rivuli]